MTSFILLVKNVKSIISDTLESIISLRPEILIADMGSTDGTIAICKKYRSKIIKTTLKNRSNICNQLLNIAKNEIIFYLLPGEMVIEGHEEVEKVESCHRVRILNDGIITKELRVGYKNAVKFKNPIYETLLGDNCTNLNITIYSKVRNRHSLQEIELWEKDESLNADPHYYKAIHYLEKRDYKNFKIEASKYLFKNQNEEMAATMIKYYSAITDIIVYQDFQEALKNLVICIYHNPLMAEFWCLLGDIHVQVKEYQKALVFYENAKMLGEWRLESDIWPIDIAKYDEYPEEMIEKCNSLVKI